MAGQRTGGLAGDPSAKESFLVKEASPAKERVPRLLLAAAGSGSGKTMITCGLLAAFQRKGIRLSAFKCGPDYIDPLDHGELRPFCPPLQKNATIRKEIATEANICRLLDHSPLTSKR